MTDPIADLLTRIRNGLRNRARKVKITHSKTKSAILKVLKQNGFILDYRSEMENGKAVIQVDLKYGPDGEQIISHLRRISKPGRRIYLGVRELESPLSGLGISVLSTPRGIVSDFEAKRLNVGGEVICEVW
jgi:small subunit ribosomal protein S8